MIRSKNIEDYFSVDFSILKPNTVVPFAVHLYFIKSNHVIVWKTSDFECTTEFLTSYLSRGISKIYIHNEDRNLYLAYIQYQPTKEQALSTEPGAKPVTPEEAPKGPIEIAAKTEKKEQLIPGEELPKTEAGGLINEVLENKALSDELKQAVVAETALNAISEAAKAKTPEEDKEARKKLTNTVEDILRKNLETADSFVNEILNASSDSPDLDHGVTVATYGVLFGLSFGKIDKDILMDLAMSGLLHDLGMIRLAPSVCRIPWTEMNANNLEQYHSHVMLTQRVIRDLNPSTPERVQTLVVQHHEKFNGSGYPQALKGFMFEEIAQILSMADLLASMQSGRYDGKKRMIKDALEQVRKVQKTRTFPEYYNPDLWQVVLRWMQSEKIADAMTSVADVMSEQSKLVQDKGGAKDESPPDAQGMPPAAAA